MQTLGTTLTSLAAQGTLVTAVNGRAGVETSLTGLKVNVDGFLGASTTALANQYGTCYVTPLQSTLDTQLSTAISAFA